MAHWKSKFGLEAPCWDGYREFFDALPESTFPAADALSALLPTDVLSRGGQAIRFVPAADLPGVDYERCIFETGQVSTRENSWHDLFNALVWCRMPQLKTTMNSMHFHNLERHKAGSRGRLRDALTLLDESGVILAGSNVDVLDAISCRDWNTAFIMHREAWGRELQVLVCGHAILEKFLNPYKSITAHALLLHTPRMFASTEIDRVAGESLAEPGWLDSPSGLSPLPLMGIPGWWPHGDQDGEFYADQRVFRPPSGDKPLAPVHSLPGRG